jgi:hypothetical protein
LWANPIRVKAAVSQSRRGGIGFVVIDWWHHLVNTLCGSVGVAQFAILFPTIVLAFWVHGMMPNQEAARGNRIYLVLVLFLQVFPRDKSVFLFL